MRQQSSENRSGLVRVVVTRKSAQQFDKILASLEWCSRPLKFSCFLDDPLAVTYTNTRRKRVDAFLSRAKKRGFCAIELQTHFSDMVNEADQRLFDHIRYNSHHVLHELLPPISVASQNYELRARAHNREIPCWAGSLSDSNFITRMTYNDCYWVTFFYLLLLLSSFYCTLSRHVSCMIAFRQFSI